MTPGQPVLTERSAQAFFGTQVEFFDVKNFEKAARVEPLIRQWGESCSDTASQTRFGQRALVLRDKGRSNRAAG